MKDYSDHEPRRGIIINVYSARIDTGRHRRFGRTGSSKRIAGLIHGRRQVTDVEHKNGLNERRPAGNPH